MALGSVPLRRLVRTALAADGGSASAARLSSTFNSLCERLHQRLRPIFGGTAVDALFARAVHLAATEFPWLTDAVGTSGSVCSADGLAAVRDVPLARLEDGLAAVLIHTIELLNVFVGEDLVLPIVEQAWSIPMLAAEPPGPKVINE
jgi:hypothetical protein